jgi:fucose permease
VKFDFRHTLMACCVGNVALTVVNFLPPLLFVTFRTEFGLSAGHIAYLVMTNFGAQTLTDLLAARYVDGIGYRRGACMASLLCAAGLISLAVLPYALFDPYLGLLTAIILMGVGGGLTEVLASPIVEAIPGGNKVANMSLLHAFFGWGFAFTVFLSSLYFITFGIENWRHLLFLWAILPLANLFLFLLVPIRSLGSPETRAGFRQLFSSRTFLLLVVMMISAGAAEMAVAQWVSYFAETGLGISKSIGDLVGACGLGVLIGLGRSLFSRYGNDANLPKYLTVCCFLCLFCYGLITFSPNPLVSLAGCTLCGLGVSITWPGVFSLAALTYREGGTAMFALMALAGDIGCALGPGLVGMVSGWVENARLPIAGGVLTPVDSSGLGLRAGFLVAAIFPVLLTIGVLRISRSQKSRSGPTKRPKV